MYRTYYRLAYFIFAILVCFPRIIVAPSEGPYRLPRWFWDPPNPAKGITAVGYSNRYSTLQSSYDEAFNDAARRLFIDTEVRVIGERGLSRVSEGLLSVYEHFEFIFESARLANFAHGLVRIDSFATRDLVVMLVGTTNNIPVKKRPYRPILVPKARKFQKEGTVVQSGISQEYYYRASSWRMAEQNARIEAALGFARLKALEKHGPNQDIQDIVEEVDVVLKNIETVARTIDPSTGAHIVFVRVRIP